MFGSRILRDVASWNFSLLLVATMTIAVRAGWRQAPFLPEIWDIPIYRCVAAMVRGSRRTLRPSPLVRLDQVGRDLAEHVRGDEDTDGLAVLRDGDVAVATR